MKKINILLSISLLFLLAVLFCSCEDDVNRDPEADIDCSRCYEEYPHYFELELQFSIDETFTEVNYKIYNGYAEAAPVVYEAYTDLKYDYVFLESGLIYSVVAVYYDKENDRTIYVVNEFYPTPKLYTKACSEECYFIAEDFVNMRIKRYNGLYFP
jgi:hypothetical protein